MKQHNKLQMPTWRWLGVNETAVKSGTAGGHAKAPVISGCEQLRLDWRVSLAGLPGLPPEAETARALAAEGHNAALTIEIPAGLHLSAPAVIEFELDEKHPHLYDYIHIRAGKNSRAALLISYRCAGAQPAAHTGFTYLEGEPGCDITLIKSQLLCHRDFHADTTVTRLAQGAAASILLCEIGGGENIGACNILLEGADSRAELNGLYIGSGRKKLDFSYRIEHRGPNTQGRIAVTGALAGQARKTMRSTVDFITGASGAKGGEEETVVLLSDKAVSLSAPLLLCGEDDVQGEHAASIGRLNSETLFYLMSRGLSEKAAKRLLLQAAFAPLLNKVTTKKLQRDMLLRIQEVIQDDKQMEE